jgi:hypothetical protein
LGAAFFPRLLRDLGAIAGAALARWKTMRNATMIPLGYKRVGGGHFFIYDQKVYFKYLDPSSFTPARFLEVSGADGGSFAQVPCFNGPADLSRYSETWGKDRSRVYCAVHSFEVQDPLNFELLSMSWARDSERVYWINGVVLEDFSGDFTMLEESDPKTFEPLNSMYGKDSQRVYGSGKIIRDIDPMTLKTDDLASILKDRKSVFFDGKRVPGADPSSFIQVGEGYFKDQSNVWFYDGELGKVLDVDAGTFQILPDWNAHGACGPTV